MHTSSLCSTFLPTLVICCLFDGSHSDRCEVIFHCGFDLHFPDYEWCWASFHVPVGHPYVFFGKMSIHSLWLFLNWTVCILNINPLSDISFANIFSHSVACLFVLSMVSLTVQNFFLLWCSPICLFLLLFPLTKETDPKILLILMSKSVLPMFSSRSFIISGLTFKSLIHLSLFLYMVGEKSSLLQVAVCFSPPLLIEETFFHYIFLPLCCRLIDHMGMCFFFWTHYSVPLIYVSVFVPIPHCSVYLFFHWEFKVSSQKCNS